ARPTARRWPIRAPASRTGSRRYHAPVTELPTRAAPEHASGTQVRAGAPRVEDAMTTTAASAATAGPARRNQRDSTMVDGPPPAAGRWAGGGRGRHPTQRRFTATYRRRGDVVLRSAPTSVERCVVAKPVRFRHSPATVNRPRAEVRS